MALTSARSGAQILLQKFVTVCNPFFQLRQHKFFCDHKPQYSAGRIKSDGTRHPRMPLGRICKVLLLNP